MAGDERAGEGAPCWRIARSRRRAINSHRVFDEFYVLKRAGRTVAAAAHLALPSPNGRRRRA
eukprot:7984986-Heterocapsa_arctica.AAC.1